ncbi:hypothetical protein HUG10_18680 (plasmid) [Halorarum halophilum]|uniref:Uncharacterized protein n=1 Tax=Halorarum halophilum TaxID=2743090 RepID=A0A7D5KI01_9EURY|nr:hypothetical protein [Halobaculum halophilum]QLG29636.1 hypothetical protein HUG10_18680 [Halobaculum halophilum]
MRFPNHRRGQGGRPALDVDVHTDVDVNHILPLRVQVAEEGLPAAAEVGGTSGRQRGR